MGKKYELHDGAKGAALAVRVIPRATKNEIVEVLKDGTVKVRIKSSADNEDINNVLLQFFATLFGVEISRLEILGGEKTRSKLISIINMDAQNIQNLILKNLK